MLSVCVFSLLLGGSFLLLSILGALLDTDADLAADFDADLSFGGGATADAAEAIETGHAFDGIEVSDGGDATNAYHGTAAAKIFSMRVAIHGLFEFGALGSGI